MTRTQGSIEGFEILSRRALPEYRADGLHLRHVGTGCEVVHLASADPENLFAFCFTTPPRNDTGVSHIIEHSVLSGSDKFHVKEPFSALMKGSMHTFLNALTYPDRTVYPAASCNRADFFNLLTVYGDAVFRPLLRKETFMQEAWRLEEADGTGAGRAGAARRTAGMRFAGIVYNEMKGVVFELRLHRLGVDLAVALPGHPLRPRLGRRPRSHTGPDPGGGPGVSRALLPSVELPDLPLRRHPAGGNPLVSPRQLPVRLHGHRHGLGHSPAEALGQPAPAGEDRSR